MEGVVGKDVEDSGTTAESVDVGDARAGVGLQLTSAFAE